MVRKQQPPRPPQSPQPETDRPPTDRVADVLARLLGAADVRRAYGEPLVVGDRTILPAAEVLAVAGFGMGSGAGVRSASEGERRGGGGGGGGGGRVLSRAVAVVEVSPDGIRVRPVFDATKIALAALTAAGFVLSAWGRMSRAPERSRPWCRRP